MRASAIPLGAALLLLSGCPDAADQFTNGRLLDPCNGSWPVCTTTAGCFVGNAYYLEGQFPGTRRFIVRTDGQASIALSVFLTTQGAVGHDLQLVWNDAACGTMQIETIDGQAFFKEVETEGLLVRTKNVFQAGDHLIEVSSDTTAEYLLKADVASATQNQ